ncbi:MAG: DUF2383 domain-containing protein [Polyangiaceae bacterium]|nr:DUF2383 domain-containing protein [Polyangiaceae bacterium]
MGTESKDVKHLDSFLRGELAAVETYRMALQKLDAGSLAYGDIQSCLRSHEQRVELLRDAIVRYGGRPSTSSGPWGVFAKTVEGGAVALGDKVAIAALEEGEDHGLKDYRGDLDDLDTSARQLVERELLPRQIETHLAMSNLKKTQSRRG